MSRRLFLKMQYLSYVDDSINSTFDLSLHLLHVPLKSFLHHFLLLWLLLFHFCHFLILLSHCHISCHLLVYKKALVFIDSESIFMRNIYELDSYVIIKQCPPSFCWPVFCSGFSLFFPCQVLWKARVNILAWVGGIIVLVPWIVLQRLRACYENLDIKHSRVIYSGFNTAFFWAT